MEQWGVGGRWFGHGVKYVIWFWQMKIDLGLFLTPVQTDSAGDPCLSLILKWI